MFGIRVQAPPIVGEIPPHNLVDAAWEGQDPWVDPNTGVVQDWRKGVKWRPTGCVEASAWNPNCSSWPKNNKSAPPTVQPIYEVDGFVIEVAYGCTLTGEITIDDIRSVTLQQLELATPKALEFAFWENTLGSMSQALNSENIGATGWTSSASIITGASGPFDRKVGLALAGQSLANCGAGTRGMIHAPAFLVELWMADGLLMEDEAGNLVTKIRRDRVVAGSGYTGSGPGGIPVTDLDTWIYATGPVEVYLEQINPEDGTNDAEYGGVTGKTVTESFDRLTNYAEFRAERMALVRFDPCCHSAVLIDAGRTTS